MSRKNVTITGFPDGFEGQIDSIATAIQNLNQQTAKSYEGIDQISASIQKLTKKTKNSHEYILDFVDILSDVTQIGGDSCKVLADGIAGLKIATEASQWASDLGNALGDNGLGSILQKLGGAGGWIGLAVTAVGFLATAFYNSLQESSKLEQQMKQAKAADDMRQRFGDLTLSIEEMEKVASRVTQTDFSVQVDVFISEEQKLDELEGSIQESIQTLDKMNWKVSVGMELSEEEEGAYKETIDKFVKDTMSYIEGKQYTANLALTAVFGTGSQTGKNVVSVVNSYYNGLNGSLKRLGDDLAATVNEAFENGTLDRSDVSRTIAAKQAALQAEIDKINDAEYHAELKAIQLNFAGTGLTEENFDALSNQMDEKTQENIDNANAEFVKAIELVELTYNSGTTKDEDAYNAAIAEAQQNMLNRRAEIQLGGIDFKIGAYSDKFKDELEITASAFKTDLNNVFSESVYGDVDFFPHTAAFMFAVRDGLEDAKNELKNQINALDISEEARTNMGKIYDGLTADRQRLEAIQARAIELGMEVPAGVAKGLNDINKLGAIAGNEDALNYFVGQQLAESDSSLETLEKVQEHGGEIPMSLLTGMASTQGSAAEGLQGFLTDNLDILTAGLAQMADSASTDAGYVTTAYGGSFTNAVPETTEAVGQWLQCSAQNATSVEDETSPLQLLSAYAKKGAAGYDNQMFSSVDGTTTAMGTWLRASAGNTTQSEDEDMPEKLFRRYGDRSVSGYNSSVLAGKESTAGSVDEWINPVKEKFTLEEWLKISDSAARGLASGFGSMSTPHIRMPRFSISYDPNGWGAAAFQFFQLPGTPSIDVKWYREGGIFAAPTVIGIGEGGREAALPLNSQVYAEIARGILTNANSKNVIGNDSLLNRLDRLEQAVRGINLDVALYANDREIARSSQRGNAMLLRRYRAIAAK